MNIGIIGVGRLGLAYALTFEQKNFTVYASSYKQDYVENLQQKKISTVEPGITELLKNSKNIHFTVDNYEVIKNCDVIYVMVATPSRPEGDYDVSAVMQVVDDFISYPESVKDKILIIGSTVNPGTCKVAQEMLSAKGVHVVYAPTFVAQGSVLHDIQNSQVMSVGAENVEVADTCKKIFSRIVSENTPIFTMSSLTAEILKLAGNCKMTMQISFVNMIGQILLNSGLENDLKVACNYLGFVKMSSRFQFGFGYGGPCYPRDNRAFVHFARQHEMDYPLGELIDNFNQNHITWLTNYFIKHNSQKIPFYFSYVSYKKGVSIFEESHQLAVCKNLLKEGFVVYVELSEFLLPKIQQDLSNEFTDLVKFVKISDLNEEVYKIDL